MPHIVDLGHGSVPHLHDHRSCLTSMPHRRRSALACLTISTDIDGSAVCFGKGNHSQSNSFGTNLSRRYTRPSSTPVRRADAELTRRPDTRIATPPATPFEMDTQRQNPKTSSPKQVQQTSAQRPVSRSSSMQVEDGNEPCVAETSLKAQDKGACNSSYSMDRWLSQKPREEPWHGR